MRPFKVMRRGGPTSPITLKSMTASDQEDGIAAAASISFTNAGLCDLTGNGADSDYTWMNTGPASAYEIKVDVTSGSFNSGTTGSWLPLSTTRTWSLNRNTGAAAVTATCQIRNASTLAVLAGPVSMNMDVDAGGI